MALTVRFWGTRGSIPCAPSAADDRETLVRVLSAVEPSDLASRAAIEAFIAGGCRGALPTRYGGETACVELRAAGGDRLVIDLGSGARLLAGELMRREGRVLERPLDVLLSHLHWDHIQGLPFFGPAYVPGNRIRIHGCHDGIAEALRRQQAAPFFPVPFDELGAAISVSRLEPGVTATIAGFAVTPFLLRHAGDAYAYRVERDGRAVVYASDGEHKPESIGPDYPYVDFVREADMLIFDAQYSLAEAVSIREDWGHSSNMVGVELALLARVRHLVLFHHDPLSSDARLDEMLEQSRRFEQLMRDKRPNLMVSAAWDGLELGLP